MPTAYILIGIPGSGKTTWAFNQDWINNCVYISTDKIVEEHAQTLKKTYSEIFENYMPQAVNIMIQQVLDAKNKNKDIIWDQTSTTIISRIKKFRLLPEYDHIAVIFPIPNKEELERRLKNRPEKIIPEHIIKGMIDNFQPPTLNEGYREIWYAT